MNIFAAVGLGLIGMVLAVVLRQAHPPYAVLVSLLTAVVLLFWAIGALRPLVALLERLLTLSAIAPLHGELLLKAVAISLTCHLAVGLCTDAGESALGEKISLCARVALLLLAIPLAEAILALVLSLFGLD